MSHCYLNLLPEEDLHIHRVLPTINGKEMIIIILTFIFIHIICTHFCWEYFYRMKAKFYKFCVQINYSDGTIHELKWWISKCEVKTVNLTVLTNKNLIFPTLWPTSFGKWSWWLLCWEKNSPGFHMTLDMKFNPLVKWWMLC